MFLIDEINVVPRQLPDNTCLLAHQRWSAAVLKTTPDNPY
jgi:hypothetical protein